jgi:hypothetical protein
MAQVDTTCADYKRCSDVSEHLQMDQCWWLRNDYSCECPVSNVYFNQPCPWKGLPEGTRWDKDDTN